MRRVTAIDKDGNIYSKESLKVGHNELVYELFEEFLKTLQDEKLKGDWLIQIWTNAGLITKYLDMMLYLEVVEDLESIDVIVCTIPEEISRVQLDYFDANYLSKIAPFQGLYYHDDMFSCVSEESDKELTADEMHSFLKDIVKEKTK